MLRTVDLAVAMPIRIQTAEDVNASLPADAHGLVAQSENDAIFSVCDEMLPRHRRTRSSAYRKPTSARYGWRQMRGRDDAEFSSSSPGSGSTAALNAAIASRSPIRTRRAASTEGPAFDASKSS